MSKLELEVSEDVKAFVDLEAARAGYANAGEYVNAVLESLRRESAEARLESKLIARIEGPEPVQLPPAFWARLKARLRQPVGERAPRDWAEFVRATAGSITDPTFTVPGEDDIQSRDIP